MTLAGKMHGLRENRKHAGLLLLIQLAVLVLFGSMIDYGPDALPKPRNFSASSAAGAGLPGLGLPPAASGTAPTRMAEESNNSRTMRIYPKMNKIARTAYAISLLFVEAFVICGSLACLGYPRPQGDRGGELPAPLYQDVHVMIWIGFGFLMTFLKRYSYSALGLTFLLGALLVQVAMLCEGALNAVGAGRAPLSLDSLLNADVAVAAPLISMGALLGKTSYMQLLVMGVIELVVFNANKYVGEEHFLAVDPGGSMYVHAFGAYFGLAISFVLGMRDRSASKGPHPLEGSSYESDVFAMIGTLFLWLFWPSFNAAGLQGDEQRRAVINTLLSIAASCVTSFATSALVSKEGRFSMVHVQNSTLAGGVAIGTAAGMMCQPYGALTLGALAGAISVLGYAYATPAIARQLQIHDTCGVHNLHGIPAILAGLFGALLAGLATEADYNYSLYEIFPGRIPVAGPNLSEINENYRLSLQPGPGRSPGQQAGYQLLALLVTLAIAIVSGLITGLILKMWDGLTDEEKFTDAVHWDIEDDEFAAKGERNKDGNATRVNEQMSMGSM